MKGTHFGKLIESVRAKPQLWDRTNPFYHNKDVKCKLWKDVCRETGCHLSYMEMKQKWANLRDVFRRELKKMKGAGLKKRKWAYYDQMMFLLPSIVLDDEEKEDPAMVMLKECRSYEDEASGVAEESAEDSKKFSAWAHMPDEDLDFEDFSGAHQREAGTRSSWKTVSEDDDYHFAMSLIPSMRQVPFGRKLRMRMNILNIVYEATEKSSDESISSFVSDAPSLVKAEYTSS